MAFDVLPEPLDRVEIGAIGRQIKWFDVMPMQTFCRVPAGVVEHENNFRLFAKNNCRNAKIKIVQTFKLLQYEASHVRALLLILIPAHSLSLS